MQPKCEMAHYRTNRCYPGATENRCDIRAIPVAHAVRVAAERFGGGLVVATTCKATPVYVSSHWRRIGIGMWAMGARRRNVHRRAGFRHANTRVDFSDRPRFE